MLRQQWRHKTACWIGLLILAAGANAADSPTEIRLATQPALSPDGSRLAFAWNGDLWQVDSAGGPSVRLTSHAAPEGDPRYSPDGRELAFVREVEGAPQLHVLHLATGLTRQLTYHSEGCRVQDWFPDGKRILISATRDHFWRAANRLLEVSAEKRGPERELFDDYGADARISPDGTKLLFTREGERWWRKGYRGSRASQVWQWSFTSHKFQPEVLYESESRTPLWHPDGKSYYYVSSRDGCWNLWERSLLTGSERQVTRFTDDGVVEPAISRDGRTVVFRVVADLYRWRPEQDESPQKIVLSAQSELATDLKLRRVLSEATDVAFSTDGLEMALIAGGDVWVMDTELREPKQVTNSPEEERSPVFAPDGSKLLFVSDQGGQSDLWEATRGDSSQYWWRNDRFTLRRLTEDAEYEDGLQWSPTGEWVAFSRARGDLWVIRPDGKDARRVIASWNELDFDWSPDGKWFVYAQSDAEFNRDVFLLPLDGSRLPFNLSRHPDNDGQPRWSPDGRKIAFLGRRMGEETDIYYVHLRLEDEERDRRDRTLEKALEKIQKARKERPEGRPGKGPGKSDPAAAKEPSGETAKSGDDGKGNAAGDGLKKPVPEVRIDFEDLPRRLHRVAIDKVDEEGLFWSHDSTKLAFTAEIAGTRGTHVVTFPDDLKPKLLTNKTGRRARWIAEGNQVLWLSDGKPGVVNATGGVTTYEFNINQSIPLAAWHESVFDQCWRVMRDHWYDGRLNNRNWDDIRRKYGPLARAARDQEALLTVVHMMLGELNGSHLGISAGRPDGKPVADAPREQTAHFGLRFDPDHRGPGLLVRDVIPDSPAAKSGSRIEPQEVVLSIDGRGVDPGLDLTTMLNGLANRDVILRVRNSVGQERNVTLRPISFTTARGLLYEKWVRENQAAVEKLSGGKLGYLHIRGMDMPSFLRFEEELFAVASGKDGILIDVRDNGGGFTTDHLLTILTQPEHAITVPRGGERGYPQDRRIYATWRKPIVVLCNQNSFSNAEIFSHAIKTLGRGKVVGVTTAGGVISTGAVRIMDTFTLRLPHRGWYLPDTGFDMELNGARPHFMVWPRPGDLARGLDRQLERAVDVLEEEVRVYQARPQIELRNASQRP